MKKLPKKGLACYSADAIWFGFALLMQLSCLMTPSFLQFGIKMKNRRASFIRALAGFQLFKPCR